MPRKIKIHGTIVSNDNKWIYDWFGIDAVCPRDVEDVLNSIEASDSDQDIEVTINSGGGDVFAGSEIYTLLKSHKGKVTGTIMGIAASAASIIGMACNPLRITPTAQIMIHNVSSAARGDYRAMQHTADFLKGWNKSIANAYRIKTGMPEDKLLALMNKETWLTAQEALQNGFVDEILFNEGNQLVAASTELNCTLLPDEVINKMREFLAQNKPTGEGPHLVNSVSNKEGVEQMPFEEFLNSLPKEQRELVENAIEAAKTEAAKEARAQAEAEFEQTKNEMQATINDLQNQLQNANNTSDDEEILLANADPKLRAMLEAARKREQEAQAALNAIKEKEELNQFKASLEKLDKLPVNAEEMAPILRNLAKNDKEGYDKLYALLQAANNCMEAGAVFNTNGSKTTDGLTAWDKIQNKVKEIKNSNPSLTEAQAFKKVLEDNPDLYNEYLKEQNSEYEEE